MMRQSPNENTFQRIARSVASARDEGVYELSERIAQWRKLKPFHGRRHERRYGVRNKSANAAFFARGQNCA